MAEDGADVVSSSGGAPAVEPKRSASKRVLIILGRVLFSLLLGFSAVLIVGIVGLFFLEGCPLSETGGGLALCFRKPAWVDVVQALVFVVGSGYGWWISGLIAKRRMTPPKS